MRSSSILQRLQQTLGKLFGTGSKSAEDDLHSAHTILAPAPPGGMRRVLPKRRKPKDLSLPPPAEAAAAPAVDTQAERARDNIGKLLARDQAAMALQVFSSCVKLDKQFQPAADSVLPLAREAMRVTQPMLALRVMQRFDVLYPEHADIPQVILLSAQAMQALHRYDGALLLLSAFRQYFPGHALTPEVDALAAQLTRRG